MIFSVQLSFKDEALAMSAPGSTLRTLPGAWGYPIRSQSNAISNFLAIA
ncbi:hypothetical protein GRAN_3936 [Granulicella sibirica]|uniref:Uncharacterized protein n=1 Tax=Granulicella sibirica TaxID=2479048 RepID=A0A4Q0SWP3_9BACT|nr:hypothetical protein GRAN_3936 [Granulicella sibirica]